MKPRFTLAKRKAQELLKSGKVKRVPVPVDKLARIAGASVHYEPFDGQVSGMVHRQGKGAAVIGVNSAHSTTRQRFTIAHEIGHLILHAHEKLHVDERFPLAFRNDESSRATQETEIEANQFAAALLMPVDFLQKEIESLPEDMEDEKAVAELARRFEVSEQAMTIRLTSLGALG